MFFKKIKTEAASWLKLFTPFAVTPYRLLKLVFERNTSIADKARRLGTTWRGAGWSNLHPDNIRQSLTVSGSISLLTLILTTIFMAYYLLPLRLIASHYGGFSRMAQDCIFEGASNLYEMQYALAIQAYWAYRSVWALVRTRLDKLGLNNSLIFGKVDPAALELDKVDLPTKVPDMGNGSREVVPPKVGPRAKFTDSDSVQVREAAGLYKAARDQVEKPKDLGSHSKDCVEVLGKSASVGVLLTSPSTQSRSELPNLSGVSSELRTKDQANLSLGAGELASLVSLKSPSYVLRYDQLVSKLNVAKDLRWIARDSLLDRSANLSLAHQDTTRLGVGRASAWFKADSFNPQLSNSQWLMTYDPVYAASKFNNVLTSGSSQRALAGRLASQVHVIDLVTWGRLLENSNYSNNTVQVYTSPTKEDTLVEFSVLDLSILPQLRNQLSGTVNLQSSITSRCNSYDGATWVTIPDTIPNLKTSHMVFIARYTIKSNSK